MPISCCPPFGHILLCCEENLKFYPDGVSEYGRGLVFRERRRYMVELSKLVCYYQFLLEDGTREARETQLIFHWRKSTHAFYGTPEHTTIRSTPDKPGLCCLTVYQALCLFTVVLSSCMPDLHLSVTSLPSTPPASNFCQHFKGKFAREEMGGPKGNFWWGI